MTTRFDEYQLYVEHTQQLSERRQSASQTFLTINTGIFTILAFLVKDAGFQPNDLIWLCGPLFIVGIVVCLIWRNIITSFKKLISWRYEMLREMEQTLPDSVHMLHKEWDKFFAPPLHRAEGFSFSDLEGRLPAIFIGLYSLYGIGGLVYMLWR